MEKVKFGRMDSCFVIAEIGVNHNGDIDLARKTIDAAVEAGANAVKFQAFDAEGLAVKDAPQAEYQRINTGVECGQYEMLKRYELGSGDLRSLCDYCECRGIHFLASPFSRQSAEFMRRELGLQLVKVASGEITNAPLLWSIARGRSDVILSTGMSGLGDIEIALGFLAHGYLNEQYPTSADEAAVTLSRPEAWSVLGEKVVLLHCVSEYPAEPADASLSAMDIMAAAFGLPVGYSDHTLGIWAAVAAAARGASVIEKHITYDKNLPGPDHKASLDPAEFRQMVEGIRAVEKVCGGRSKSPVPCELKNRHLVRRSVVAATPIKKGDRLSADNMTVKRPSGGISPVFFYDLIGKRAGRDYATDDRLEWWFE
ncbi:MAG: N-acetylneuraminate synthase [Negativicutes bacterium]|nr:N-acetylneuraminate synthase [Negativicutes bacterium]